MNTLGSFSIIVISLALATALLVVAGHLHWWYGHFKGENFQPSNPKRWKNLQRTRWLLLAAAGLLIVLATGGKVWQKTQRRQDWQTMQAKLVSNYDKNAIWQAPDWTLLSLDPQQDLVRYGRDLVAHTTDYFGEKGLLHTKSINSLNCQNCHLEAGSKPFGNNYSGVAANYPKMRARSGQMENAAFRVNDCFQRSLNGTPLDTNSREMHAIVAYINWLGSNVPQKVTPKGVGLKDVPFLSRAANPSQGATVYASQCARCHGTDGQGVEIPDSPRFYPPLWGSNSYAESAGLFRLSRLAAYVQANMPFGVSYLSPQLSDEEAWDVAAFINSQPRPTHRFLAEDWPDIAKKTFDHPFGPYADTFSEIQHKYGPFQPIIDFYKAKSK